MRTPSRRRRMLGVPLLVTALLAGACGDGGEDDGGGDAGPGATSAAAAPTAATPSASQSSGGRVTIPKSAFADLPPELRKSDAQPMEVTDALPGLCDQEFRSGGRSVTASAAMTSAYKQPKDPPENVPYGTLHQTVFAFEGTGAADYLRRVRGAVADCRSFQASGGTVTVRSQPMAGTGDEALLVTVSRPATGLDGSPAEGRTTSQILVIRVADAVTVVHDQGWEGTSNDPGLADDVARAAVRGLDSWQR
ncbi:hypothetical protein GA0070562_4626 [Micromonospora tulbaghiae]|uniref:PknH-like extracellular domain-containing protein n=2 Tax=Micromonospora tulbaghiae TaxID=479978 RepID=A0ABY0KPE9_9ACTN|nr:hypothetical protein [Micromonospora tulbaghiae]SCE97084.1 hypothetical protein GA0070562_4626 [Micromonospora tulbaghiae]